jgi:PQQ-dependent dehydrogenase (methanol/ethanol family)
MQVNEEAARFVPYHKPGGILNRCELQPATKGCDMKGNASRNCTMRPLILLVIFTAVAMTAAGQNVNWLSYGNDLANTRFQNLDQINPKNVQNLKVAWVFHTGVLDPLAELEASPIVHNGTMYIVDGHSNVFALNAATGKQIWAYKPTEIPGEMPPLTDIKVCCGRVSRGVGFAPGRVYLGRLDGYLIALNAETGRVVWKTKVVDYHERFALTMAPVVVHNLVIVGSSGGEYEVRGQVAAFDAHTGDEVWRFRTTSGAGWGGDSFLTGGAAVWSSPAIDPSLQLMYINTGNAGPDINGINRIGDNLYAASIVALDIATGQPRWHFQETHHDLWDYDSAQSIVLFSVNKKGEDGEQATVPALGHCSKNGNYYILDRRNGTPIFPVTEVAVPTQPSWQNASTTQPVSSVEPLTPLDFVPGTIDMAKLTAAFPGIQLAPEWTLPQEQLYLIVPGDDGGCEWSPAGYSPRTGYVYYGTRYEPTTFQTNPSNVGPDANGLFLGSTFDEVTPQEGVINFGLYGATDTNTGKVKWKIRIDQPAKSGVLVAGDLVFFGEGNGKFHAVDARTGQTLWTFDGPADPSLHFVGGAESNPVAYMVKGREYIVNAFGSNVPDRNNFPPNPVGDAFIAFSLPGDE